MAVTWSIVDLIGAKDGSNVTFSVPPTPDATTLNIIFNGRFLYRVAGSPAADEYVQSGTTITLGLAPNSADQLWTRFSTTGVVLSPSSVPAASRKNFYWIIELRNKENTLIEILQPDVNRLSWEYATVGGCGECEVSLRREFDRFGDIDLDYDVQVWRSLDPLGIFGTRLDAVLPFQLGTPATGARELRYSGFIREITPIFDEVESVKLRCSGYSRQLEYLAVFNATTFGPVTYTTMEVSAIVTDLVDSFVVLGSKIKRTGALALVLDTGVVIQELTFNGSVWEALKTLAEIGGNAEVGVRADREIYFTPRQNAIKQTYNLGNNIKLYESTRTSDDVVNWVFLQGGDGTFYKLTNGPYQSGYQKERVILVPAISQPADAALWGISYFARFGAAQPSGTLNLAASDDWIENVGNPMGLVRVFGGPIFIAGGTRLQALLPLELGKVLGATTDQSYRIASISYTPSENGLRITVQLGERSNTLADQFRNIEYQLSALRMGLAA
jgi:hypothetical protein